MQRLKIDQTESSFFVDLNIDKGEFLFSGESRPENAPRFFEPIINWLDDFKENYDKVKSNSTYSLKVVFNLDYFNSTSTKYIVDIIQILKEIGDNSYIHLTTEWHYKEIDEDIEESGRELVEWTGLNMELIPYK
ncbi:MAG: DUF1987 domain-containing protein [Brumimicrobium sp.]